MNYSKNYRWIGAAILVFGVSTAAEAGRGANQHARIRQGVRSGQLTRGEAKSLRQEQRGIREDRKAAAADGKITREERANLREERNEASKNIYNEKHDTEVRE